LGKEFFSHSLSKSLPRYQSDHNILLLTTYQNNNSLANKIIRFEKRWMGNKEFKKILPQWWNSCILREDVG
jgi:hypothetical protein